MCIICAKPANTKMPSSKYIKNMWEGNSDGAGIMWTNNNKVHIKKGFMDFKSFKRFLTKLSKTYDMYKTPLVMHFRITTHGGTKPQNTHPFPVVSNIKKLQALEICTDLGVAHNGTIKIDNPPEISDTMAYISKRLSRIRGENGNFYKKQDMLEKIENEISSKMCFLDNRGNLEFIGHFIEDEGIKYSNTSYLGWRRYGTLFNWDNKYDSTKKYKYNYLDDEYEYDYYDNWEHYYRSYDNPIQNHSQNYTVYTVEYLMEVPEGCLMKDGELIEGEIFVDSMGKPYLYDPFEDVCTPTDGVPYTSKGLYPIYREEKAEKMRIKEVKKRSQII